MNTPCAADRLRQALSVLCASGRAEPLTASALCQMANVSRNSLYRYHADVLQALHEQQRLRARATAPRAGESRDGQRAELATLREQLPKLAALVDHYYAAYREIQALLQRRERELSELRRRLDAKTVRLTR